MVDKADPHWYFSERFKYTLSEVQINSCVVLMFNVQRSNKNKVSFDSIQFNCQFNSLFRIHSSFREVILISQWYQIYSNFIGMTNREFGRSTNSACNHFSPRVWLRAMMQLVRSPDLQPISIYRPVCSGFRTLPTDASINIRLHTLTHVSIWLWDY